MNETRRARGEIRATQDGTDRYLVLRPIVPNVVDDYGSVWAPDVFDVSLGQRMPTLAWGHSWVEPIGRAVSWDSEGDLRSIRFRLDNGEDVPMARRAFSQVMSGTIDDVSVGFSDASRRPLTEEEQARWPGGVEYIMRANLDEVSLVLRGAVPGAKVLATRSAAGPGQIDGEFVLALAAQVQAGEISAQQARIAIDLVSAPIEASEPEPPAVEPDVDDGLEAEAAALLEQIEGRSSARNRRI